MDHPLKRKPASSTSEYTGVTQSEPAYGHIPIIPTEPGVSSLLLNENPQTPKKARWGINWLQEPLQLPAFTILGIGLAIGHHVLYLKLDDNTVDTESKLSQQALKQAGNAFAFLVIAACRIAIQEAYNQHIWMVFRKTPLKIGVIDKVFSLLSTLLSFFSIQILVKAKIALLLGIFSWLLFLGALTPAATLNIVPAIRERIITGGVPTLNYSSTPWSQKISLQTVDSFEPTALTLKLATRTALDMAVIPPPAPALNATFGIQFYGPTLQCNDTNNFQKESFNFFSRRYAEQGKIFTADLWKEGNYSNFLVYSAFSPTIQVVNQRYYRDGPGTPDAYRNWQAEIIPPKRGGGEDETGKMVGIIPQELWVQTAASNIVCSLVNASFDIGFEFTNGVGKVARQHVVIQPPAPPSNTTALNIRSEELGEDITKYKKTPYFVTFQAFGNTLFGNVSMTRTMGTTFLAEQSSPMLQTGLVACDEIGYNYWYKTMHLDVNGTKFPHEPWMCRNKTLARGIEDLANNITISMLSSANLTMNTTGEIRLSESVNVYRYNQKFLLASYGTVIFVTLVSVVIGVIAILQNGVYHNTDFSTVMATTRNRELDDLAEGACLGDTERMKDERLMFGVLTNGHRIVEKGGAQLGGLKRFEGEHAAFGFEGSVTRLKKGDTVS